MPRVRPWPSGVSTASRSSASRVRRDTFSLGDFGWLLHEGERWLAARLEVGHRHAVALGVKRRLFVRADECSAIMHFTNTRFRPKLCHLPPETPVTSRV